MKLVVKAIRFVHQMLLRLLSVLIVRVQISSCDIKIGKSYTANGIPSIMTFKKGRISIGEKFKFNSGPYFNVIGRNQRLTFQVWGNLQIGNNVRMSGTTIVCKKEVIIGDDVLIGGNVVIYDTDFHSLDHEKRNGNVEDKSDVGMASIVIGDGAFIGGHSTILKGAVIGKFSIVGACSVVTGNIPGGEIWAGNPARFIRTVHQSKTSNESIIP